MVVYAIGHNYYYMLKNICFLFYPGIQLKIINQEEQEKLLEKFVYTSVEKINNGYLVKVCTTIKTGNIEDQIIVHEQAQVKPEMAKLLYLQLHKLTSIIPPWGTLTGVRPVKLFLQLLEENNLQIAQEIFQQKYLVSKEKIDLVRDIVKVQQPILNGVTPKDCSVYISVPFCPSRCHYCSFVSANANTSSHLIQPHLDCLLEELQLTKEYITQLGFRVKSVYIGGGTPTTLTARQLEILLQKVNQLFKANLLDEFTVEAGRPDTIDLEKLLLMKQYGVNRLNVNPQSLNDHVLKQIGRNHTVKDIFDTMELARQVGFENINMDLIAGLQGETFNSFIESLEQVIGLQPTNITLHTLYMKRASQNVQSKLAVFRASDQEVGEMVAYCAQRLKEAGFAPFYMYRQRNTVDNLENTGYSKPGFESVYNIWIMDESHTIFGCGAGAVTKLIKEKGKDIQRIYNYKLPFEYIKNFEIEKKKKEKIMEFFKN